MEKVHHQPHSQGIFDVFNNFTAANTGRSVIRDPKRSPGMRMVHHFSLTVQSRDSGIT